MNKHAKDIVDINQREDIFGRLYAKKGFAEKAIDHYENLLQQNSCNYETYYKILNVKGVVLFDQFGQI